MNKYEYLYSSFDKILPSSPRPGKYYYAKNICIDFEKIRVTDLGILILPKFFENQFIEEISEEISSSYFLDAPNIANLIVYEQDLILAYWHPMNQIQSERLDKAIAKHDANVEKQKKLAKEKMLKKKEKERQLYEKLKLKYE